MNEMLLQFIWYQQLFNVWQLATTTGEKILVLDPGQWNHNQGPDFLHARLEIGGQLWCGQVELHVRASDWTLHGHDADSNYDNVILHVVWEKDEELQPRFPVAELREIIPVSILQKLQHWSWKQSLIPCEDDLRLAEKPAITPFLHLLAERRMMQKARLVMEKVEQLRMDWQEAFWRSIARSFGYKVNADAFESIASTLSYSILLKIRNQPLQLEALLMGQGGLLRPDTGDPYAKQLYAEFVFLRKKYKLAKSYIPVHFLRMRPVNFPTVRLAQLAMLIHDLPDLFRMIKEWKDPQMIRQVLRVGTSSYWDDHYRFNESSVHQVKLVGEQMVNGLMVNTIIPYIIAFHQHIGQQDQVNEVLQWTSQLPAEHNSIIHAFSKTGMPVKHMQDAQGLIELHKTYCQKSACTSCAIGQLQLKRAINTWISPKP